MLCPGDDHRAAVGQRQDSSEASLPERAAPPVLCTSHRIRTRLRHVEGFFVNRRSPRLVPDDGTHQEPRDARRRRGGAQHAHHRQLRGGARRRRAASTSRPADQNASSSARSAGTAAGPRRRRGQEAARHRLRSAEHLGLGADLLDAPDPRSSEYPVVMYGVQAKPGTHSPFEDLDSGFTSKTTHPYVKMRAVFSEDHVGGPRGTQYEPLTHNHRARYRPRMMATGKCARSHPGRSRRGVA